MQYWCLCLDWRQLRVGLTPRHHADSVALLLVCVSFVGGRAMLALALKWLTATSPALLFC